MADWTNISNDSVETGKPGRAIDGRALRDNPIAISEGSKDAPRIQPKALADGTILFGPASTLAPIGANDLGGIKRIQFIAYCKDGTGQVRFSGDNGATWPGGWQSIGIAATNSAIPGWIDLQAGSSSVWAGTATNWSQQSLTVPANCNAIQFRQATGSSTGWFFHAWVLEGRADV